MTLSMRAFGPRNSAYAFWPTTDIYHPREISIEHPSDAPGAELGQKSGFDQTNFPRGGAFAMPCIKVKGDAIPRERGMRVVCFDIDYFDWFSVVF